MNMTEFENWDIYLQTLEDYRKYHQEAIGLTEFIGGSKSNALYPQLFNFEIILLLKIFKKIETLEGKIKDLEKEKFPNTSATKADIDKITIHLQKLNLENGKDTLEVASVKWKYW